MNKGDSIRLILDYSIKGKEIQKDQFDEIELQLNRESFGKYNVKLLLSEGDMAWNDDIQKYVAFLPIEESFKMPNEVDYQLIVYNNVTDASGKTFRSAVSSRIGRFFLGDILPREMQKL